MKDESENLVESNSQDDLILDDNQLVCLLTGDVKKESSKENNLQSLFECSMKNTNLSLRIWNVISP